MEQEQSPDCSDVKPKADSSSTTTTEIACDDNIIENPGPSTRKCTKESEQRRKRRLKQKAAREFEPSSSGKYVCNYCQKEYQCVSELMVHIKTHTGELPFTCGVCDKGFREKLSLTAHMRSHTPNKPHACHICEKRFRTKLCVKMHVRTHFGERRYRCKLCQQKFTNHSNLSNHIKLLHKGSLPHQCLTCFRKFRFKYDLVTHIYNNCVGPYYFCASCGKRFENRNNLTVHATRQAHIPVSY